MNHGYQARWITREEFDRLRRLGAQDLVLLDSLNGFIVVEPGGRGRGDDRILSREEADWELQPVWYTGPKSKLARARLLLGLDATAPTPSLVGAA